MMVQSVSRAEPNSPEMCTGQPPSTSRWKSSPRYGGFTSAARSAGSALDALNTMMASTIQSLGTTALVPRMWQLRDNLSGYDAAYVAAAETHGCPLVTADVRLARSGDLRCEVRLALPND